MTGEIIRFIREEIRKQLSILLFGSSGANASDRETIENMYPGQPGITGRPIMHPYGLVSRAPNGTISVVGKTGEHAGNRMTLGHMDRGRPSDVEQGEATLYSSGGYQVRVKNGQIEVGKNGNWETVMLGEATNAVLSALITEAISHVHTGNLAIPTTPSLTGSTLTTHQATISGEQNLAKD